MNSVFHHVCSALARHLEVDSLAIEATQNLEHDWGLDRLDLALLVVRIEDLLDVELPMPSIEHVRTVGELAAIVGAASKNEDEALTTAAPLRERMRRSAHLARKNRQQRDARRVARGPSVWIRGRHRTTAGDVTSVRPR